MRDNPISATLDYAADGVQHGYLRLPYSRNDSAWGSIMIPICVIKNGTGPRALLTGGNHGDEYEGPGVLTELAHSLRAEDITGTVIIIPFMNQPAFAAGTRVSPLDDANMNRVFPGQPQAAHDALGVGVDHEDRPPERIEQDHVGRLGADTADRHQ